MGGGASPSNGCLAVTMGVILSTVQPSNWDPPTPHRPNQATANPGFSAAILSLILSGSTQSHPAHG